MEVEVDVKDDGHVNAMVFASRAAFKAPLVAHTVDLSGVDASESNSIPLAVSAGFGCDGASGTPGTPGFSGTNARITLTGSSRSLHIHTEIEGKYEEKVVDLGDSGILLIRSVGGNGSNGLDGMDGSPGENGKNGTLSLNVVSPDMEQGVNGEDGKPGGNGGDGGDGGDGGNGGNVIIYASDVSLFSLVEFDVRGGNGGMGGKTWARSTGRSWR